MRRTRGDVSLCDSLLCSSCRYHDSLLKTSFLFLFFRSSWVVTSHTPLKYPGSVMQLYAKMSSLDSKTMRSGLERSYEHVVWSRTWKFYQMEKKLRLGRKELIWVVRWQFLFILFWSEIFCVFQGGQKVREHFGLSSSFLNKWDWTHFFFSIFRLEFRSPELLTQRRTSSFSMIHFLLSTHTWVNLSWRSVC